LLSGRDSFEGEFRYARSQQHKKKKGCVTLSADEATQLVIGRGQGKRDPSDEECFAEGVREKEEQRARAKANGSQMSARRAGRKKKRKKGPTA